MYEAPEVKILYALANVAVTSAEPSDDLPMDGWN